MSRNTGTIAVEISYSGLTVSLKNIIKTVGGKIGESVTLRPLVRNSARHSVNIVYYHLVGEAAPHYRAFYRGCDVSRFARDLNRLREVFDFAPLPEVLARSRTDNASLSRPQIAVTFDDGFDLYATGAMEVLDHYGIKATTFVITSCVGNKRMMWRHMLSAIQTLVSEAEWRVAYQSLGFGPLAQSDSLLAVSSHWEMIKKDEWATALWSKCPLPPVADYLEEHQPYFSWEGLRNWISAGHTVGFHTDTHPYCARLRPEDLTHEIIKPASLLKESLGMQELYFSYPFGDRFPSDLEYQLFKQGVFQAFFGINGFSPAGTSYQSLERAGVEGTDLGWSVYAAHSFPWFR